MCTAVGQKLEVCFAKTIQLDGSIPKTYIHSNAPSLADRFEYVTHGPVYNVSSNPLNNQQRYPTLPFSVDIHHVFILDFVVFAQRNLGIVWWFVNENERPNNPFIIDAVRHERLYADEKMLM